MEKQTPSNGWYIFFIGVFAVICMSAGFSYGINHAAQLQMEKEKNYKPLYTSRIVVKCADIQVIAFTTAECDSTRAKDNGWWLNKLLQDTSSTIVVENIEWPYNDECF